MLTEQEVFDKVVSRLMDGTGRSVGQYGCSYLNKDGLKCAVGIFLPDNKEMQSFGGDIYGLIEKFGGCPDFPDEILAHRKLLNELQYIHDRPDYWDGKKFIDYDILEETASKFNLKYERPEDVN